MGGWGEAEIVGVLAGEVVRAEKRKNINSQGWK